MTETLLILGIVIVVALAFDFTNGFHDTANAMATSIATGALKPKTAVLLSAVLNLVGAFLSIEVALTVTKDVIKIQDATGAPLPIDHDTLLTVVLAGLVGGVLWNLITWLLGIPSSSSHALFGGLVGATLVGLGNGSVKWSGIVEKVAIPAVAAPLVAGIVSALGTWLIYRITQGVPNRTRSRGFRWGQIGSASLVSLAHGTNDAQKTMGVITLTLIAAQEWTVSQGIPWWGKVLCALAIALGTYSGGWRVIRTLGHRSRASWRRGSLGRGGTHAGRLVDHSSCRCGGGRPVPAARQGVARYRRPVGVRRAPGRGDCGNPRARQQEPRPS